jgi:hypothetical protein
MSKLAALFMVGCMTAAVAGCAQGGSGVEFIAANSSTVLVDYTRDNVAELDTSKQVALEKCGMFGGHNAVLESINARGDGRARASYLCQ